MMIQKFDSSRFVLIDPIDNSVHSLQETCHGQYELIRQRYIVAIVKNIIEVRKDDNSLRKIYS